MVVNRFKLKSKKMAILISMITSTLLVSLLGTLAGSNAIIAPLWPAWGSPPPPWASFSTVPGPPACM